MRHMWMFSQPTDPVTDGSKLTVSDLKKVFDQYELDPIDPPSFDGLDMADRCIVTAVIYEEDGQRFFEMKLAAIKPDGRYIEFWQFNDELPSEDVQVLLGILPELGYTPLAPQFGAFGYEFKGDELSCEAEGYTIFRMHGNELLINLPETVGAAVEQCEAGLFIPAAFTVLNHDKKVHLVIFFIEEHGYSRHLSPVTEVWELDELTGDKFKLGKKVEDFDLNAALDELYNVHGNPEDCLAVCGLIIE